MTDMKLMESKAPTYEVIGVPESKAIAKTLSCEIEQYFGAWVIVLRTKDDDGSKGQAIRLTASGASAVAAFITAHVRKRW